MDFIVTYGIMTLDIVMLLVFFYIIFTNLPIKRIAGAVKGILFVVFLWFVARLLNFHMAEAVLGQIIQYGFLAVIILFPNEFRKLLENIGRRRIFSWNTNRLISMDSRRELANAVINMARKKTGAIIVIAREDNLSDEAEAGAELGELDIKREYIEMIFSEGSEIRNGAVIIRDDAIISANARLPLAENDKLREAGAGKRHLAGLGIVVKRDSMSIVVSADTGHITMIGYIDGKALVDLAMPLREYDLQDGIDEQYIMVRIEDFLRGKEIVTDVKERRGQSKSRQPKKKDSVTKKDKNGKPESKRKATKEDASAPKRPSNKGTKPTPQGDKEMQPRKSRQRQERE